MTAATSSTGSPPPPRAWFRGRFAAPTAAQAGAWDAISSGAPRPGGRADRLGQDAVGVPLGARPAGPEPPPAETLQRCRVLYVSPMKALAVDVERNLRSPLVGIGHAADPPRPAGARHHASRSAPATPPPASAGPSRARPTDMLITTPESLFLMLTSQAREALAGVETVIVDEVHAVAGTKRGAHLALSLERLDALLERPAQRVGLSATVRPVEEVARFLAGGRPVEVVQPPSTKEWDLEVVVPVADMSGARRGHRRPERAGRRAEQRGPRSGRTSRSASSTSSPTHRSTLVFANSRRLAERLTARLNEIWEERLAPRRPSSSSPPTPDGAGRRRPCAAAPARTPAQLMAQSGASRGAPPVLARAHHGSVSKEQRAADRGRPQGRPAARRSSPPAASSSASTWAPSTWSIQVESPPSVASGLQRVGRAGHQVGAVSRGVLFPKFRGDLVQTAVVVERMRAGADRVAARARPTRSTCWPSRSSRCARWTTGPSTTLEALVRRAAPFATLPALGPRVGARHAGRPLPQRRVRRAARRASSGTASTGTLTGRPGAQRLAVTSGRHHPRPRAVRRVPGHRRGRPVAGSASSTRRWSTSPGSATSSRWARRTLADRGHHPRPGAGHAGARASPAGCRSGRATRWAARPSWAGRSARSSASWSALTPGGGAGAGRARPGSTSGPPTTCIAYLDEQREATRHVPDDRTIVVERFRDELGDWRVAVPLAVRRARCTPRGRCACRPGCASGSASTCRRCTATTASCSGCPTSSSTTPARRAGARAARPGRPRARRRARPGHRARSAGRRCSRRGSASARRGPCCCRAAGPTAVSRCGSSASGPPSCSRSPASTPRSRSCSRRCASACRTSSTCPGLVELMRRIGSRAVTVVDVETQHSRRRSPAVLAVRLRRAVPLRGRLAAGRAPRRRPVARPDPARRAARPRRGAGAARPARPRGGRPHRGRAAAARPPSARCPRRRGRRRPAARARPAAASTAVVARVREGTDAATSSSGWLAELEGARQVIRGPGRRRGALGGHRGRRPAARRARCLAAGRRARRRSSSRSPTRSATSSPATPAPTAPSRPHEVARAGRAGPRGRRRRPAPAGRRRAGWSRASCSRPRPAAGHGLDFCDAEVLRTAAPPVAGRAARRGRAGAGRRPRPLPAGLAGRRRPAARAREGLVRAVEQLAGAVVPASALETLVLPGRVADYRPALLDELTAAGEVALARPRRRCPATTAGSRCTSPTPPT